jgi:TRAP-type C4-dicarboxylate transport system substrate-binding protein
MAGLIGSAAAFVHDMPAAQAATKYCDGPKITWRTSLWGKRRAITEGLEHVVAATKDATCGNFDIQLFYGEQLSKSKENLDAIKVGAVQGAQVCSSYHPGKLRALGVLDLPFLPIANLDVAQVVYDKMFETAEFKKSLADWSAVYFMATLLPQFEVMGRGTAPAKLAEWKGKRVRALGGMGKAMEAIGAVPTSMPASEVYTALQRGTIEAVGFSYTYAFVSFKIEEISSWYTTNMALGSINCVFALGTDAYDKLPPQYKTILNEVQGPAYQVLKDAYESQDKVNLPKWQANPKLKAVTFTEAELEQFRKAGGTPVWNEWIKQNEEAGIPGKKLLDLVLATAKEAQSKKRP